MAALYNKTHPDYVSYLYLLAPVSLVILNPFGFVLMEIGKHESLPSTENGRRKLAMATNIMYSIITNPVVLMTVLGMVANFICNHKLPIILADTLNVSWLCIGKWTVLFVQKRISKRHVFRNAVSTILSPRWYLYEKVVIVWDGCCAW